MRDAATPARATASMWAKPRDARNICAVFVDRQLESEMEEQTAIHPARRLSRKTSYGSTISISVPAGVSDEEAWAEQARWAERIRRGYTIKGVPDLGGFRINTRWLAKQPRPIVWLVLRAQRASRWPHLATRRVYAWTKFRALDAYWFFRERPRP